MGLSLNDLQDELSNAVDSAENFVEDAWDTTESLAEDAWDSLVHVTEGVAGWFGIEDETVVQTAKVSSKIYEESATPLSDLAVTRAVLTKTDDTNSKNSFFDHYWFHINSTKVDVTSFYKYGLNDYVHGLPEGTIHGAWVTPAVAQASVEAQFGATAVALKTTSGYPSPLQYFQEALQASPTFYKPPSGTLTYTDSVTGASYTDWTIYHNHINSPAVDYSVYIHRQAALAEFWITGDSSVTEGDSANYTVHCTRTVPAGKSVTIDLVYGGAAPGSDYTPVTSVVMLENTSSISFSVPTVENASVDGNRAFTVSIGTITNTGVAFERVAARTPSTVSTTIFDDDAPSIRIPDKTVAEGTPSVTVDVILIGTPGVGFTVDYTTVAGTALAGADYTTTSGTLTFVGTLDELQSFTVDITSDLTGDTGETFFIQLSNCSDPSVDITSQGIVTITDGTVQYAPATLATSETLIMTADRKQSIIVEYHFSDTDPLALDWKYWIYDLSTQVYPSLKAQTNQTTGLELLPMVMLRKNGVSVSTYSTAEELKSTRDMLNILHIELDALLEGIEASPDITYVKDAYLNIGVSPSDTGPLIAKLLWHTFYRLVEETPVISNQDRFYMTVEHQTINNSIGWLTQSFEPSVTGVVGDIGTYTHSVSGTTLYINKQIGATTYERLTIGTVGSLAAIDYQGYHEMAAVDLGDPNFTFPVSLYAFNQLTPKEQTNIYDRLVRVDFYAISETEVAWYLSDNFIDALQLGLVVLAVFTGGASIKAAIAAEGATGIAAASIIALEVGKKVVLSYAVSAVVSKVAKETGSPELAVAAGVALSIALASEGDALSSLGESLTGLQLLELSINFSNLATNAYNTTTAIDIAEDVEEAEQLSAAGKARLDELEEAGYASSRARELSPYLKSVDTLTFPAVTGLYEFDALYDYDRIIANYHDNLLLIGVV